MISIEFKQRVIDQLKAAEKTSGLSAQRFATSVNINPSQWSRIKNGDIDGVLSDARYISLGRELNISIGAQPQWVTVQTATFQYMNTLLDTCHRQCISTLLVDLSDIGKSHVCKYYARENRNAIYIDCSQVKSRQLFVREIARLFGSNHTGKYADVYKDLIYYLNSIDDRSIIILDEAGDLKYDAFLEIKALWNATEGNVGWFMTGADGLQSKIERSIRCVKVGYTEIFRRFGSQYRRVTPGGKEALESFKYDQIAQVAVANAPAGTDIQKLVKASRFSLTNLYNMIKVLNSQKAKAA